MSDTRSEPTEERADAVLADAAETSTHEEGSASGAPLTQPAQLALLYGRYLAVFVGAGLLAGAVVHFPLAPARYALMGLLGAGLFAAGSAEAQISRRDGAARVISIAASLALALAVGMVAGGIQHFSDIPARGAVLIPSGLALGLVAFAVRDGHRLSRRHLLPLGAGALAVLLALGAGLGTLAGPAAAGGGHSHAPAAGHHAPPTDAGPPATREQKRHTAQADGHAHHHRRAAKTRTKEPATPDEGVAASRRSNPERGERSSKRKRRSRDGGMTEDEIVAAVQDLEARYAP